MGPLNQTQVFSIRDSSQIAVARRAAAELAQTIGLDEQRVSAVNVVVVELANNLLQHGGGGEVFLSYLGPTGALEVAAVDRGRGMINVERCMQDGYSTASTPGLGLGAINRFSQRASAYSIPNRITVVAARLAETSAKPEFSVVCTAIQGETLSGDNWCVSSDGRTYVVVDGLGHGVLASEAAAAALRSFQANESLPPPQLLECMHSALRSTRGAAAAIAQVDEARGAVSFAGVGNIGASLLSAGKAQSCVSHNGTLGHQLRRVQAFEYTYQPGTLLVMQSDGLTTHTKIPLPPDLVQQSPSVIAPLLYSEQLRGRDDATVLVARLA